MFREIVNVYRNLFKGLIDLYTELWSGEEYSDVPTAFKVIGTIIGMAVDVIGIALLTAIIPLMLIVGAFIKYVIHGSFDELSETEN